MAEVINLLYIIQEHVTFDPQVNCMCIAVAADAI